MCEQTRLVGWGLKCEQPGTGFWARLVALRKQVRIHICIHLSRQCRHERRPRPTYSWVHTDTHTDFPHHRWGWQWHASLETVPVVHLLMVKCSLSYYSLLLSCRVFFNTAHARVSLYSFYYLVITRNEKVFVMRDISKAEKTKSINHTSREKITFVFINKFCNLSPIWVHEEPVWASFKRQPSSLWWERSSRPYLLPKWPTSWLQSSRSQSNNKGGEVWNASLLHFCWVLSLLRWSVAISWRLLSPHSRTEMMSWFFKALLSSSEVHGQSLEFSVHAQ